MRKKVQAVFIGIFFFGAGLYAQDRIPDSLWSFQASFQSRFSSTSFQPHYMVFQNLGLVSDQRNDFLFKIEAYVPILYGETFRMGLGLVLTPDVVSVAGLDLSLYGFQVRLGYGTPLNMGHTIPELSSGNFLSNQNYRTAPGIALGFFEYTTVPFTFDYLKFKGSLEHYWTQESRYITNYQKHRKTLYIGTQNLPVNIFAGVDHVVLFGGTHESYGVLPSNFKAYRDVFLGRSQSQPTSKGGVLLNEINAYGNHVFTMEWGIDFTLGDYDVLFHYQKPADDALGYLGYWDWVYYKFLQNEDVFLGITVKNDQYDFLSAVTFEYIHTLHQNGRGLSDVTVPNPKNPSQPKQPHFDLKGKSLGEALLTPPYIDYLAKKFGNHVRDFDEHQILKFVSEKYNGGHPYGGRTSYYSNALYPNIYFGNTAGTPLFYTKDRYRRIRDAAYNLPGNIANNSVHGFSFGFRGELMKISYRALFTFTRNYGIIEYARPSNTKDEDGHWAFDGTPNPNYFFFYGKQQNYALIELDYRGFQKDYWKDVSLNLGLAYDFGQIYHAFGLMLGVGYHLQEAD